jgi:hypothetical protein
MDHDEIVAQLTRLEVGFKEQSGRMKALLWLNGAILLAHGDVVLSIAKAMMVS